MKQRILGIDTGTNSLGWAVVDRDENNKYTLIDRGDLIFQEGVKIEKGKEKPKAADRTEYRSKRRQYFRRRLRKIEVLKVLSKYGLCPALSAEELNLWHTKKQYPISNKEFMEWQRTDSVADGNPYYCRYVSLFNSLDLSKEKDRYLLGRALYHLAQRRGFLSNRLDDSPSSEDGKVNVGISRLSELMLENGCEYLGEYFYKIYTQEGIVSKIRGNYVSREEHYKKEFYAICKKQCICDSMLVDLERALYFQRPLKSQKSAVGFCPFEKKKKRCADSHPYFEEYRMLSFINEIKIKTPFDDSLRFLNENEKNKIKKLFFRKSKNNFDFEDIAKELAGKNNYSNVKDKEKKPYVFNYRMSQGVASCHTIAELISVFGNNWDNAIMETYTKSAKKNGFKSKDEVIDEIWNALYSFSSKEKLKSFAMEKLQLDDSEAEKFSAIKLNRGGYASLSLNAVRKIIPLLRDGMRLNSAIFIANMGEVVPYVWNDETLRRDLIFNLNSIIENFDTGDRRMTGTLEYCIKDYLLNNYDIKTGAIDKLYHPSLIEHYKDAEKNSDGIYQLGSPMTNSLRNPMAMRSLNMLRKVVNKLLKDRIIDKNTEIHIEYARELNDANKRKAIASYNKEQEDKRRKYEAEIIKLYKKETGKDISPTKDDILKFILWEEQNHIDIYTGKEIRVAQFLGSDPIYDKEHTIARSVGGDSTMMNMTLCSSEYNRKVKKAKLPVELDGYNGILQRISPWKKRYEDLQDRINKIRTYSSMPKEQKDSLIQKRHRLKMEYDYWYNKYTRFTMKEVPEGFSLRQGSGAGLISRYAGLYLKSLFNKGSQEKSNVYTVKGLTTEEFRKMWGLQNVYEKKQRDNHVHHCIDAIVIACMGKSEYAAMAKYYHDEEQYLWEEGKKPNFPKPWDTFTEDVGGLEKELMVVHSTSNRLLDKGKKLVETRNGRKFTGGDIARGSLHKEQFYGAIKRDGAIKYVIRKSLADLEESDVNNIVDKEVRQKVRDAIDTYGFKKALEGPVFMNREKGIEIKKVRCITGIANPLLLKKHRDLSRFDYKQNYYVTNDSNYLMAIYEGERKGKIKRDFLLVNNLNAAKASKKAEALYPASSANGYPLKFVLKSGTQVLFYENEPDEIWNSPCEELVKRLYKVTVLSSLNVGNSTYGVIEFRHHQEARAAKDLSKKNGIFRAGEDYRPIISMYHTQVKALIEGVDFELDILGRIHKLA